MLINSLISKNHRDRNGDFTGDVPKRVEPILLFFIFVFYFLFINMCLYVYFLNVSGEISPIPRLERNNKIGWWCNQSDMSRVVSIMVHM